MSTISPAARQEFVRAWPSGIRRARRSEKRRILDEFVALTG